MVSQFFESHRGGIEIVAGYLARELARQGLTITWLSTDVSPPPAASELRCVPVCASNLTEKALGFPYPLLGPSAVARIAREVARADVVMLHDALYLTSMVAAVAARLRGMPIVLLQHVGAVPYRNPLLRAAMALANRLIARPMLARVDQTVFISQTTARYFGDVAFRAPPRLIFNGTDPSFRPARETERATVRRRFELPAAEPVALFVGRFVEKKGLAALAHLAAARPDVTFAFAGWGPLDPRLWDLPNVRVFDGLVGADLVPLYQASDVLVLPSVGEGFPLVVQEALACGLPVLCGEDSATADPAAARLLDGVLVDPDDPAGTAGRFAGRLQRLLAQGDNPAGREERASFARAHYSWETTAARHADLIRELWSARAETEMVIA
jgi:glycosyltransferase involved in cell wall biosynthesis